MDSLSRESPAKINLTLRVTGVRPDGFHEIESLVTQVTLSDTVTVWSQEDGCYSLDCDDATLPRDGSNLALRAARALAEASGGNPGARIELAKRIPVGAGLGGGSSNAATTLMLLNELWRVGLPAAELARLGAELGSDVPLFFHSPLCVLRARGELVEDLGAPPRMWVALVLPNLRCSTAAVYAAWDRLSAAPPRPTLAEVCSALGSADRLMDLLFNDLEPAALAVVPELAQLAERVAAVGGRPARMTGSGAALFRLFDERLEAERFAEMVRSQLRVPTATTALRTAPGE
jgi:4-diphosphocytidyl-2-C-methyl-D-erythritol kinase